MTGIRLRFYLLAAAVGAVVLAATFWARELYLPLSFLLVILSFIPFYFRFEQRQVKPEEIVLIAGLSAIAGVSRIPFASLPSVQPTSFVVIASGLSLGPEVGFMVGTSSALVSNFVLGQGPWTPWQMLGWGLMGWTAGLLGNRGLLRGRWSLGALGFVWGFLFGWLMNLWFVLGFFPGLSWKAFLSAGMASFYLDLAHAVSNVFFLHLLAGRWQAILERIKVKYGLIK